MINSRVYRNYWSHDCLWKVKSQNHVSRMMKETARKSLFDFVKRFNSQVVKMQFKKINNLRALFEKNIKEIFRFKIVWSRVKRRVPVKVVVFLQPLFRHLEILKLTCFSLSIHSNLETRIAQQTQDSL